MRRYDAAGVMPDNNQFLHSATGKPTCYCESCRAKFVAYVGKRFAEADARVLLGQDLGAVTIPLDDNDPLWGLWLAWRKRVWAEVLETYRRELRKIKPDVVVLANTQYAHRSHMLAADGQFLHEDAVLSESRGLTPGTMAAKMIPGRALSQGRPPVELYRDV